MLQKSSTDTKIQVILYTLTIAIYLVINLLNTINNFLSLYLLILLFRTDVIINLVDYNFF